MAFVDVNPRYRALLAGQGLVAAADFLDVPGVLVGGHADRDIARVTLGEGPQRISAYLKREHHLRWRDRLASAWAGFGMVSRSCREALLLRQVRQTNIECPEVIAAGADRQGRAFLLVRELAGTVDLRRFLSTTTAPSRQRREIAVRLGRALAAIHAAGFQHPDLYSKHVLVRADPAGGVAFAFLDWQRARRCRRLTLARCWRDLAALDATVADDLVTPRERLLCLHAYCRRIARSVSEGPAASIPCASGWYGPARAVRRHALRLLRRRRIRELRQPPLAADRHQLVQLTAQALNLTRQFRDELKGQVPAWLRFAGAGGEPVVRVVVPLTPVRQAALVRRRVNRPLTWLWHWLRGRPLVSPEVAQAGTLFRLERYGIRASRLLAFGQRSAWPWRLESLLLTEVPADTMPLGAWLTARCASAQELPRQRRRLLREAGAVLRRLHEAACHLGSAGLWVQGRPDGSAHVLVAAVEAVRQRHRPSMRLAQRDLAALLADVGARGGRTDALRLLLAYLDVPRLTTAARRVLRRAGP